MGSFIGRVHLISRAGACILAGVPSTLLIPLPITQLFTKRFQREDRLRRLHRMVGWARFCRKRVLGIDLDVVGREHLPSPSRGHMYVSNHQSWADILVLAEALDTVAFLSKTLIRKLPVLGRCAYAGGTVYVERDDGLSRRQALRETLRMCKESTAVVIFPEGTRSPDGELQQRVHPAAIRAAYDQGIRVVPVAIDGSHRVLPKTMDDIHLGQRVAVTVGQPLDPKDYPRSSAFAEAVWNRVHDLFAETRARAHGQLPGGAPTPPV